MGFFDRFRPARSATADLAAGLTDEPKASFGPSSSIGDSNGWFVRALNLSGGTDAGVAVTTWSAITLPVVYACVSIIADNIAQLPLNIYRSLPSGGRELAADHPLQRVLHDEPNEEMSSFVFRQTVSHHALLWGNGYAEIERKRNGQAVGLWPLFPDRTRPEKPPEGRLRYVTQVNAQRVTLPPEDVLHIPALGFDGILGYSPVAVARQAVGLGLAAEKFGAKFFANDAKSGGFLMHPGKLGDPATKNVAESFQKQGGTDNAFKVKVLEEGMKFISTTIPPDDAQFLVTREFQVAELARIYRVPLVLLQSMEKSSSWGTGIEQMMIGFVVWTMQPWLVRWEQELNRKLLTEAERAEGYFIKFNLNALLRGDMKARAAFYKDMWNIRAMNPNEIRAFEELNPYADGDRFADPLNMAGQPDEAEEDESAESPPPLEDEDLDSPPPPKRKRKAGDE